MLSGSADHHLAIKHGHHGVLTISVAKRKAYLQPERHVVFRFLAVLRLNTGLSFFKLKNKGSCKGSRDIFSASKL